MALPSLKNSFGVNIRLKNLDFSNIIFTIQIGHLCLNIEFRFLKDLKSLVALNQVKLRSNLPKPNPLASLIDLFLTKIQKKF